MQTATKVAVTVRTVFSAVSSGVTCVLRSRYQGRVKAAGVTADLDPPLRRFGPPYQTFLLSILLSYLVTNSICKLFCRCSFQSQHNISSIKVKKNNNSRVVPILPHSL